MNNLDNKTYTDAIIKIRLYDKNSGSSDAIENFDVSEFANIALRRLYRIRIFDNDLTTPLSVVVDGWSLVYYYMDIFVKIPQLEAGVSHSIYLCWTTEASDGNYDYVPVSYQTAEYGRFINAATFWNEQNVFNEVLVVNDDTLLSAQIENIGNTTEVYNKANTENNGTLKKDAAWATTTFVKVPATGGGINTKCVELSSLTEEAYIDFTDFGLSTYPDKGYICFRMRYNGSDLSTTLSNRVLYYNGSTDGFMLYIQYIDGSYYWVFTDGSGSSKTFTNISIGSEAQDYNIFIILSWSITDGKVGLGIIDLDDTNTTIDSDYDNSFAFGYTDEPKTLAIGCSEPTVNLIDGMLVSNILYVKDIYYDMSNTNNIDTVKNIANFMPPYETMIGYKYSDGSRNNNITFEDTVEIESKEYKNMVVWSNLNGVNFPDLNNKRVKEPINGLITAPSFLKYQYENTIIIFTRNSIHRFVLSGTPEGWRIQTESLAEQFKQVALMAPKSLVKVKDILFWLSEIGVVKWSPDEMRIISRNRVDININENAVAFFNPIRNQYIISNGSLTTKYTY